MDGGVDGVDAGKSAALRAVRPLRAVALVKQVPRSDELSLGVDGRLRREGLLLELNALCRRAVSQAALLASETGGSSGVLTLGPLSAADILREALAWGVDDATLITDAQFVGSDTLATARALAAALRHLGRPDVILVGKHSVDADTGQVGPAVAQLLGLPFVTAAREIVPLEDRLLITCERDDGVREVEVMLPAVVATAERLCEPAKVDRASWTSIPLERIRHLSAADLGDGPWGAAGSPTAVVGLENTEITRGRRVFTGSSTEQVARVVAALVERGALRQSDVVRPPLPEHEPHGGTYVAVLLEPDRERHATQLLGAGAQLAHTVDADVISFEATSNFSTPSWLRARGADRAVFFDGALTEEDFARGFVAWVRERREPWAVLAASTSWGREVAARAAAALGAGLVGDATRLECEDGRLVCWKPALGNRIEAAIRFASEIQMATIRPGALAPGSPRAEAPLERSIVPVIADECLRIVSEKRDPDIDKLAEARRVIAVGTGVAPEEYDLLAPLVSLLGAELAATRKVADRGWLPRARQVGITGASVTPDLYVAVGLAGKSNHMLGAQGAGTVVAVNSDPDAPVFDACDVGLVADWHDVLPLLHAQLSAALGTSSADQTAAELSPIPTTAP